MEIKAPFFFRNSWNKSILDLLQKTTLGTNGARYQHLNTSEIIDDLDNPLFLTLERNNSVLGNVTFCKREKNWYIRYFAFEQIFQAQNISHKTKKSNLKTAINDFFEESLKSENDCFYAYIDPKNVRSKFMCENFGFQTIGKLKTHSFSRLKPKSVANLEEIVDLEEVQSLNSKFEKNLFYTNFHPKRTKIYALKNEHGEIICSARIQKARWRIESLPGKFGKTLVKIIPYIPILNKLLNPKDYRFLVPDMVFCKDNNPESLSKLFEGILAKEKYKLMLWWIDEKDKLNHLDKKISWGIFKLFLGNPIVDVVAKFDDSKKPKIEKTIFVSGIDLI